MNSSMVIPKIEIPFNGELSPHAKKVQSSTMAWSNEHNLFKEPTIRKKYENQNIAYLACRAQPYDSFSDLILSSDYLLLFCMLDDYSDHVTGPLEFKDYSDIILSILKGNKNYTEKDPFLAGWNNWWERVKVGTPIQWQNRIIESITRCFEAMTWEIKNHITNQIPQVEEYVINRRHSGSVFVCFDLIERGDNRYLPTEVRCDAFTDFINSASNITNWTNDILSFKKEIEDGEIHNLAISVQKHNQTSMQESLDQVGRMLEAEIEKYIELRNFLLDTVTSYKEEIRKYILSIEAGIRGHYDWCTRTDRF